MTVPEAVEDIDIGTKIRTITMIDLATKHVGIGGVTLIRAAAKNHERVTILSDPADYYKFLQDLRHGDVSEAARQRYALKAFTQTADYDTAISDYFRKEYQDDGKGYLPLRYGTNPHQKPAAAYVRDGELPFRTLAGQAGYVNLLDALNAWALVKELDEATGCPAAASFKVSVMYGCLDGAKN